MPNGPSAPQAQDNGLEPVFTTLQRSVASQLGRDQRVDLGFMLALVLDELSDRRSSEERQRSKAQKELQGAMGPIDQLIALSRSGAQGPAINPGAQAAMQMLAGGAPAGGPSPLGGGAGGPNPLAQPISPGGVPPGAAAGIGAAQPPGAGGGPPIPPQLLALLQASQRRA